MQTSRKQICSRKGTSANYGETCKERFNSLRSASFEVVFSRPFAPQLCFQINLSFGFRDFFYTGFELYMIMSVLLLISCPNKNDVL